MDQASGLRQWASQQERDQQERDSHACPTHVAEALMALARQVPATSRVSSARQGASPTREGVPPVSARSGTRRQATTLLVVGLPARQLGRARDLLTHWRGQGRRWIGDPEGWQLVPVAAESSHLPLLASQQSHWALWVEVDAESFRRAWRLLLSLAEAGGPRQLLLMHPPGLRRRGLLDNLQQAAAHYLGIELVVLA
ncbi:MAG: hypothetical protein IBX53_10730 [Halomonas sp.]|uniref:hypothetical protein n=1 Tax=Halomonas sp. TaxID=1486246 RepID=UPI0019DDFC43|nr:hypothetical protein [Halomonas sp.]MBE0489543.1 hypothetical protein [Halomonas sp.]